MTAPARAGPPPCAATPDWLVPHWPAPPAVRAVCTTRVGGVSTPPFDDFNLGDHVGDDPAAVAINRARLHRALGVRPVFLRQVHGTAVASLGATTPDGTEADAACTTRPWLACTILVADCLPVLLTDRQGRAVGAAHAGWRGLAGRPGAAAGPPAGVLESLVEAFCREAGVPWSSDATKRGANDLLAWLGPCIGPSAFEVGTEVREAFLAAAPEAAACFTPAGGGKYRANLAALARQRLRALGVDAVYGNDGSPAWCTVSQPSRFFSHRRDSTRFGGTGRLAACIWLEG